MMYEKLTLLIFIYVDESLIAEPKGIKSYLIEIKDFMNSKYELRDFGGAKRFLNLDIV